jgi:phosphate-selective porin OprO/OprP
VLTEEEGKLITKGHTSKTAVTPVVKEKDGAFTLESANGRNSIQLTGRMHLDYRQSNVEAGNFQASNDTDTRSMADQFELRRARLGVKGKFAKDFNYEVVGNLPGTATIDVAFLDWAKYDAVQFRVGKFKQPFGLEQLTSSNNIDFIERSYADQISPGKKLGAQIMGAPITGATYALSAFQMHDVENDINSDRMSYAGRATLNLAERLGNKEAVFHIGLAYRDQDYSLTPTNSGNTSSTLDAVSRASMFSFTSGGRGLANVVRAQIIGDQSATGGTYGTASPTTAKVHTDAFGLEGIVAYGPTKIQAEYTNSDYKGVSSTDTNAIKADVSAWYVEGLWLITGEKYADAYKKGVFSSIKPKNEFDIDAGKLGAWEAGLRYDAFQVEDGSIDGTTGVLGSRFQGAVSPGVRAASASTDTCSPTDTTVRCKGGARSYTAGLKWILNPNLMMKANYVHTRFDYAFQPIDIAGTRKTISSEDLLMVRAQYTF